MEQRQHNTYRRYLTESGKAIPRTTAWRHFKHRLYRLESMIIVIQGRRQGGGGGGGGGQGGQ